MRGDVAFKNIGCRSTEDEAVERISSTGSLP
jgi:hypothetical protein